MNVSVFPQSPNGRGKPLSLQRSDIRFNAQGRILQTLTLSFGRRTYDIGSKVELLREKVVGMLR